MGAPSLLDFKLDQTFFGFKPVDRIKLHENLFNLIWHGAGRWDWDTVYNMPIFLRRFYISKVNKIIENQNKAVEEQKRKMRTKTGKVPTSSKT